MKQVIIVALIGITLLGCKNENNSCGQAFFGGEIINPNDDHLVLYDASETAVDTLYLDKSNRFFYSLENLNPGLHSFVHGDEYQVVFLEPSDSIMIRLNTLDFDESLVFTGNGSKKNNYLIDLFNVLQSEDKLLYELSKKEPEIFKVHLDSIMDEKHAKLHEFTTNHAPSKLFKKVASAQIDYNYFSHYEIYPFRHYDKYSLVEANEFTTDFYDYRKTIDYNDDDLKDFYPYYNFLFPHINNLALTVYFKKTKDSIFNRSSIHYNLAKLELIDSLIGNETVKNNLLKYTTRNFLSFNVSAADGDRMFESFLDKSTNEDHDDYIHKLYKDLKKLRPGNRFPDIEVVDIKNNTHNINDLIEKPTVIYFWSKAIKNHFKESHEHVKELRIAYPSIDFIAININSNNAMVWKRLLRQNKFSYENEYRFNTPETAKKTLAIHYINKVMVVDKNRTIIDSNSYMFSKEFKELLDSLDVLD